ncbi:methionyl-tRNA formyltransferase [Gammaproteobacteria bacterium]|nr:methionyl-tRNA formyltransferase [Gammaproteobacteria bacterium]
MKKLIFCIQNELIESVLRDNGVINSDTILIRDNKDLSLEYINSIKPDIIFFPHWSFKVDESIVRRFKCIAFHSAPLPFGRGGSPIQNMIIRGYKETELCSLLMREEFDTGPIYLRTPVSLKGNLEDILLRIYQAISEQIEVIKEDEIIPIEQEGEAVIFRRLRDEDNKINFEDDFQKMSDQIRMLDSEFYPSAYINIGDYKIEFSKSSLVEDVLTSEVKISKLKK